MFVNKKISFKSTPYYPNRHFHKTLEFFWKKIDNSTPFQRPCNNLEKSMNQFLQIYATTKGNPCINFDKTMLHFREIHVFCISNKFPIRWVSMEESGWRGRLPTRWTDHLHISGPLLGFPSPFYPLTKLYFNLFNDDILLWVHTMQYAICILLIIGCYC